MYMFSIHGRRQVISWCLPVVTLVERMSERPYQPKERAVR